MKRDYPDRPIVGVGTVIVVDGRVLVVKRAAEPLKGQWSIPGGAVELGETLRQAAAREALEETGLIVEAGEILEVFDSIYRDPAGCIQYHYVLVDFLCRLAGGELRAASDVSAVRWASAAEIPDLNLTQTAERVIRKALTESKTA
jgi:ADP-ribose pyrophosphatase YjhB (NUDIX family)